MDETNALRIQQHKAEITFATMERDTKVSQSSWGSYYRAQRPIGTKHMDTAAVYFRVRPQDHFPHYPNKTLVQVAPDERIGWMTAALSKLLEPERAQFIGAIRRALNGTRAQRARIAKAIQEITTEDTPPSSPARDKESSAA